MNSLLKKSFYNVLRSSIAFKPRKYNFVLPFIAFNLYLAREHTKQIAADCEASTADRIRGNYENKIRFFSPPEKIFETFASQKDESGHLVMTYGDFFRALTPYNYGEIKSNAEYLEKFKDRVSLGTKFHSRLLHVNTIREQARTHARFSLKHDFLCFLKKLPCLLRHD